MSPSWRIPKAKVGDWVRIMRGGALVLTEVRYAHDDGWKIKYVFDHHGHGDDDDILEVRSPKEPPNDQAKD